MSRLKRAITAATLLVLVVAGGQSRAEDQGQDDLDTALDRKLAATALADLTEVIRLCESALEKGLAKENTKFAEDLMAATLIQRGKARTGLVFQRPGPTSDASKLRDAALADLEKGLTLSPDDPQALFEVGRLNLLPGGDAARAAKALNRTIDLATDEPALRAKALILRAGIRKDVAKKLADMDEAIRITPGNPAALRTRGVLRGQQGKLEESLRDFDEALKLDPRHAPTYEIKASVLGLLAKYDEALICLDRAHELRPKSVQPLLQKARIHVAQKNLDAALIDLDLARSIDADDISVLVQKAQIHVAQKNLDAALIDLELAHSIKADDVSVLLLRAGIHQEMGDHEQALADADEALRLKPEAPAVMRSRAMVLAGADKLEEATAQLEKSLEVDPKDVATRLQLGMFYNAQKKSDKALQSYSAVLADHPEQWMALRGRGDVLLNLGKHELAITDYEKAVRRRPEDSGILNNLAWVLATSPVDELRDGKRAIELATKACELTEYKQAHILSTLAAAFAEAGDFDTAIKWSEKGVEIGSKDQQQPLTKELESYRAGKPWRELLPEEEQEP